MRRGSLSIFPPRCFLYPLHFMGKRLAIAVAGPIMSRLDSQAVKMSSSDIDISSSRVLIADDIQQNRELLEAYLADEGYEILMASDGQQTMQLVDAHQPDLILLDIMMPRMSGYEVCKQIKADPARRGIKRHRLLLYQAIRGQYPRPKPSCAV